MIVELTRDAKVNLTAGTVVNVSPAVANFLVSVGSAKVKAAGEPAKKPTKRTTGKK